MNTTPTPSMAKTKTIDFSAMASAVQAARAEISRLDGEIEKLAQARDAVVATVPPREDVIAWLREEIDRMTAHYPERFKTQCLGQIMARPHDARIQPSLPTGVTVSGWVPNFDSIGVSMMFLLREPMLEGCLRALDSLDWPAEVMTRADRAKRLAELDAQIAERETERDALRDQLRQAAAFEV